MNRKNVIIYIGIFLIILLQFLYIQIESEVSTDGIKLQGIKDQITDQKAKNGDLKEEYLQEQSLSVIEAKAENLGFVPGEYIYLR